MKSLTAILPIAVLSAISSIHAAESWLIDTQQEWQDGIAEKTHLEFKDGIATPTADVATFRSKLMAYPEKKSARTLRIEQSPVWLNWNPVPNIGPANLNDAPVALAIGPDNYWMFGRYGGAKSKPKANKSSFAPEPAKLEGFDAELLTTPWPNQFDAPGGLKKSKGGYHAWQSRDMVNWVHHGPITPSFGKWMTTAEFVDGKAYFYYDFPNDQDPHLYIDSDLTDGEPGENVGLAFADPSNGSDCAVIRDLDGRFHIIAEDWSPIDASKRSWDSPLAIRGVSKDGKAPFEIMSPPPVDHRTKPTGKTGTFKHPHWAKEDPKNYKTNIAEYEIHEPEQPAYGDWAAIAIGGRYYLFGDYDPAGGHEMSVGWFTSPDIDTPFEWCGNIGKGHPDPDVMFAEGKFHLVTQQGTDFTSPGPWVGRVEARVGVDTNNDGKINQWTGWQELKESYDHMPGFAKQIRKTPRIDSLAAQGRKFTDAHSASAVCSPSRYGLLTGTYPLRKNFWGPTPTWTQKLTIGPGTLTLPGLLKQSGYATACIGKWHLGLGDPKPEWNDDLNPGPLELGFDHFFGNPGVNSYPPYVYVENHRVVGLDPADPLVQGKPSPFIKEFPEKGIGNIGGADAAHRLYDDEQVGVTLREKSIEWLKQQKPAQLYDLEADPKQQNNIFADHPEVVKQLESELAPYRAAIPDTKPIGWINLKQ